MNQPQPGPYKRDIAELPRVSSGPFAQSPATKVILAVNIALFAAMALLSSGQVFSEASSKMMLTFGADFGPLTFKGQYFRLLSNLFLHFDFLHIAFNMYVLWDVGRTVERLFGTGKFLFIYFASGVVGSLASLYFHPTAISAGASGAIFGAFGALLVFLRFHARQFEPGVVKSATISIVMLLVMTLAWGVKRSYVDNAAHIGGFVGGIIAGFACMSADVQKQSWSLSNVIYALALVAVIVGVFLAELQKAALLPL